MLQDYFLIMRIKRGDTDAFELLVDKYYDQIFAYCVRRSFGNRVLASDLTQDIFLKLVQAIPHYRYKGKFFNYLYTIAVNHCHSYFKKQNVEIIDIEQVALVEQSESILQKLVRKEEGQLIQAALDQLPEAQREALILRYYQNFRIKEIATITGVGVATAQSRIHQGLQKLEKWLEKEDFTHD